MPSAHRRVALPRNRKIRQRAEWREGRKPRGEERRTIDKPVGLSDRSYFGLEPLASAPGLCDLTIAQSEGGPCSGNGCGSRLLGKRKFFPAPLHSGIGMTR